MPALLVLALGIVAADLVRTLWRVHVLVTQIRRDDAAIARARTETSGARSLQARRAHLRARLLHGSRASAGVWLVDVERAAERHRLTLRGIHPVSGALRERRVPERFTRLAAEVDLRGGWSALARWVGDLGTMPGTVAVERLGVQPAHDAHERVLDARALLEFYTPAPAEDRRR